MKLKVSALKKNLYSQKKLSKILRAHFKNFTSFMFIKFKKSSYVRYFQYRN